MKKASILLVLALLIGFPVLAQEVEEPRNVKEDPEDLVEAVEPEEKAKLEREYDRAGVNVNLWSASYTGNIEIVQEAQVPAYGDVVVGEDLDIEGDFNLENPQNVPEIEIWFRPSKKHRILISYYTVDYGGEDTYNETVEFAGYKIEPNTEFETRWKIDRIVLLHDWSFVANDRGRLGLTWGGQYYWWEVGFEGTANDGAGGTIEIDESESTPIPIPVLGVHGELNLGYGFGLYGVFTGMGISFEEFEATFTNLELGATYNWKYLHAGLGYRSLAFKLRSEELEESDQEIDWNTNHQGFLFTLGVQI